MRPAGQVALLGHVGPSYPELLRSYHECLHTTQDENLPQRRGDPLWSPKSRH